MLDSKPTAATTGREAISASSDDPAAALMAAWLHRATISTRSRLVCTSQPRTVSAAEVKASASAFLVTSGLALLVTAEAMASTKP